jgi:D-arabinose 5-phosphate isomerase GutQ
VVNGVLACSGRVHVTGVGKSGWVGRRLAASLASTGTPAHFTHAAEWAHGDLGNALVLRHRPLLFPSLKKKKTFKLL